MYVVMSDVSWVTRLTLLHPPEQLVLSLRKEYSVMDATTGALTPTLLLSERDQLDALASSG